MRHVAGLPEREFSETLEEVTSDFEHLLRTLDAASHQVVEGLVAQVLDAVTRRMRDRLAADRGTVFVLDAASEALWSKVALTPGEAPLNIRIPAQ